MQDANEPIKNKFPFFFKHFRNSPAYIEERNQYLSSQFRDLVAKEGENNLNKAKIFLQKYASIATCLISNKGMMTDAAGRKFLTPLSAYGYLHWAGDSDLIDLFDPYIDTSTLRNLHQECMLIKEQGLSFEFNGETIVGSRQFDMQPVIRAAFLYDESAKHIIAEKNKPYTAWESLKPLWYDYGNELRKLPLWMAQLICSPLPLCPPPAMDKLDNARTILFHNLSTGETESWFAKDTAHPNLGISISIHKVDSDRAWGLAIPPRDALERGLSDLDALTKIYQIRMKKHPKERLKKLAEKLNLVTDEVPQVSTFEFH